MNFLGRSEELKDLNRLKKKSRASLVCVLGRRRIGKSYLIQEYGKSFKKYFEIQGLGPHEKAHSLQDQLNHFAFELSDSFDIKKPYFEDWDEAFAKLAELTKSGEILILLDEISWMASTDQMFAAKLKSAWDSRFKKNDKLMLVICGSVSSWIEENILKDTNFEGRISLEINLKELELKYCNLFFDTHFGTLEKMMTLSITGGVPKYLEEIPKQMAATKSMAELALNPKGILFNDFDKIFKDIFQRKSKTYEKIVRALIDKKMSPLELAKKTKITYNSDFLDALHHLELSGFLSRDYYFKPDQKEVSKFSHLRIKDNYLRFYLKIIEPLKPSILSGGKKYTDLNQIKNLESMLGFQFENLVLNNKHKVLEILDISQDQLISAAPYVQKKSTSNKGACQIDLLIHTNLDVFYLCEIKCIKKLTLDIIKEVKKKEKVIKLPKRSSLKSILIYIGDFENHKTQEAFESYFYKIISFSELLK